MNSVIESLKNNPVRLYGVVAAAVVLLAFYVPDLPVELVLAFAAAVLGVGEGVRHVVTPSSKVIVSTDDVPADSSGTVTALWDGSNADPAVIVVDPDPELDG